MPWRLRPTGTPTMQVPAWQPTSATSAHRHNKQIRMTGAFVSSKMPGGLLPLLAATSGCARQWVMSCVRVARQPNWWSRRFYL